MKSAVVRFPSVSNLAGVVRASELRYPPAPMVSFGVAAVNALTGGLPRGALTEIFGPISSGRTSLMFSVFAEMTSRNEVCALVDASDAFDPQSGAAAGINLERLLWVRCGQNPPQSHRDTEKLFPVARSPFPVESRYAKRETRNGKRETDVLEQALKATDLLLQSGGFGLVVVELGDVPPQLARRVPLTTWFRFRRAVEHTPTVLLVLEQEPYAKTCASLVLKTAAGVLKTAAGHQPSAVSDQVSDDRNQGQDNKPAHARILAGIEMEVEVVRSRLSSANSDTKVAGTRKPAQSASARFYSKTQWTG